MTFDVDPKTDPNKKKAGKANKENTISLTSSNVRSNENENAMTLYDIDSIYMPLSKTKRQNKDEKVDIERTNGNKNQKEEHKNPTLERRIPIILSLFPPLSFFFFSFFLFFEKKNEKKKRKKGKRKSP